MIKNILILLLVWVSQSFFTIDDMVKFLNGLPEDRAKEAKILVINSQRSFLSTLSSPYYLIYRK